MKVFICGLDGLEYNFVREWKLKALQQEIYGKIDVSDFREINTPDIWYAFLTGTRHKQRISFTPMTVKYESKLIEWLRNKPPFKWVKGKRNILKHLGLKPPKASEIYVDVSKKFILDRKTFLDEIEGSKYFNVPFLRLE